MAGPRAYDEFIDVSGATLIWKRPGSPIVGLNELCLWCLGGLPSARAVAAVSSSTFEDARFWKSTIGRSIASGLVGCSLEFLALSETRTLLLLFSVWYIVEDFRKLSALLTF